MNNNQFSVSQAVTYAFNSIYTHLWFFIKFVLFVLAVGIAMGALPLLALLVLISMLALPVPAVIIFPLLFIFGLIFFLVVEGIWYGGFKVLLAYYDNGSLPVSLKNFFSIFHLKTLLNLLAYSVLFFPFFAVYGLKVFVLEGLVNGFVIGSLLYLLLLVPIIILLVRLGFGSLYIIDKNYDVITAFKKSWQVTRNHFWPLLGINVVAFLIYIVGSSLPLIQEKSIIAFIINLALICISLMALPIAMLMIVYAYRRLQE